MASEFRKQFDGSAADRLKKYKSDDKHEGWGKASTKGADVSARTGNRKGYASGGLVDGDMGAPRLDRPGGMKPSGSKKGGTVVNVIIAGKDEKEAMGGPPMPPPQAQRVPVPIPVPAPPQAGPGGPPGMPPMLGMKHGGRAGYKHGGMVDMDGGAGGAQGRLDKIKAYGNKG